MPFVRTFFQSLVLVSSFVLFFQTAFAGDLVLTPSSGKYLTGKTFTVNVNLANNRGSINAVSGKISFPVKHLRVSSISKAGSIVTLWAEEPRYSNQDGTIEFEGVILSGYDQSTGRILSITFSTREEGLADVKFDSGSVLANDGQGTNVTKFLGSALYEIDDSGENPREVIQVTPPEVVKLSTDVPVRPKLTSSTHPDADKWYSATSATFDWEVPPDVDAVRVLLDTSTQSTPNKTYIPPVSSRSIILETDGVFYFHLQHRNKNGWSASAHRAIKVDFTKPDSISALLTSPNNTKNPHVSFLLAATDKTSGISYFSLKLDNGESFKVESNGDSTPYTIPNVPPGDHTVLVRAVDYAGNFTSESIDFSIIALDTPIITAYSDILNPGSPITVMGTTYPNSKIEILLKDSSSNEYVESFESDINGNFNVTLDRKFDKGNYKLFAKVIDNDGAQSNYTDAHKVMVRSPTFITISGFLINWLSLIIISLLAIALIAFATWYITAKFLAYKRQAKRNLDNSDPLFRDLSLLINTIAAHHKTLLRVSKKRDLTKEEKSLLMSFKKRLENTEIDIDKKVKKD